MDIRATSDEGRPLVASEPDGPHAQIYREIADNTWAEITAINESDAIKAPKITIE